MLNVQCCRGVMRKSFAMKPSAQTGTTAVQQFLPNLPRNVSASASAVAGLSTIANVVEPLPDISVAAAPLARKNS
jgi:hypothetical protein